MGVFNRFLLFLYTLLFGVVSLGVILLVFNVVPERVVLNEYQFAITQWQTAAVAGVVLLISIHLMFCSFGGKSSKEINSGDILLIHGTEGEVNVSVTAIREMVERIAAGVRGVREAKVKATVERNKEKGDSLGLDVKLEVGQERSIANISDEVRSQSSKYLTEIACISSFDVVVSVQSISSGVVVKKRRLK